MGKIKLPLIMAIIVVAAMIILTIIFFVLQKSAKIAPEIYGFSGTITGIKDKTLIIDTQFLLADAAQKPIKRTIRARISDQTKIIQLKFPSQIKNQNQPIYPEEVVLSFSDLKVGDRINTSFNVNISDNIRNRTEIVLDNIYLVAQ
jgi:hypothetical protein